MNDKPSPITPQDIDRELAAMTEPSETSTELWREALQRARREGARGTRRIPGRRRTIAAGALAAAVLAIGVTITMLVTGGLGGPSATSSAIANRESAEPQAGAASIDLAVELDRMLLADASKQALRERPEAAARESLDQRTPTLDGGRDLGTQRQTGRARDARVPRDDIQLQPGERIDADQPAPLAFAAEAAEPAADAIADHAAALADAAAIAGTDIAPIATKPMLERSADLKLHTEDVDEALARAASLADPAMGEYVVLSRVSGEGLGRRAAVSLRVSSSRFESVLGQLQQLGDVAQIQSTATDLSAQAADLNDRLALAIETERDILERLETLTGPLASETYEARRQIRSARGEVDQLTSQLRSIESRTAWASVRVLFEAAAPKSEPEASPGFIGRLGAAASDGLTALQGVTIWLTRALIASAPVIAMLGVIVWLAWRRFTRG